MFIQTASTPNPETMKFIPGVAVLEQGTADFDSYEAAKDRSPLAAMLLNMDEVERVFLGADFISITKRAEDSWDVIKPSLLTAIMEHFVAGDAIISDKGIAASTNEKEENPEDAEIIKQIKELIETRVRPSVAQDGGDIVFRGFEEGTVWLELHGACSGCPSSTITLKSGIENMLKYYVPEVQRVEAVA